MMRALLLAAALLLPGAARADWFSTTAPAGSQSLVTATGAAASLSLAALAAQQGVLLDAFKLPGDADDTASFTRAVAAQVPILCGPRTYTVNNFSTGSVSNFVLKGVPGCVIQRTSASGANSFNIGAANVYVDGVTFDLNKASVTANQWGVFLGAGGQNIHISRSVFKNNSGSIGSCLAILGTGPAGGGSFEVLDNEITGCTFNALFLGSVTAGDVKGNYIHDNPTFGIFASSYLTATSTNYISDVLIHGNRVMRNHTGISVGGYSAPYSFAIAPATHVKVSENLLQDNSTYGISLEGDHLSAIANHIDQSSAAVTVFGGIDALARYLVVTDNDVTFSNVPFGIDCGGSIDATVTNNKVVMDKGSALNSGGNQNSVYSRNKLILTGTAYGITNYAVEGDGNGATFPTISSGTTFEGNSFDLTGASTRGIGLFDNSGGMTGTVPNIVRGNHFIVATGGGASQDITWYGSSTSAVIDGNDHNGKNYVFIDPNGNGDVIFDNVNLGGTVYGISSTTTIRSIVTSLIATSGAGGQILWVVPSAGGAGYTAATVLSASATGGGSGWTGTAQIYNGAIVGVRTNSQGSYGGTITITATDSGGGTGATFTVGNLPTLPAFNRTTYVSAASHLLQKTGGSVTLSGSNSLYLVNGSVVQLQAPIGGNTWNVIGYTLPSVAVGSLPACTSGTTGSVGVVINVTGSTTSKWQAQCNGTNWLWPDGTVVSG